MTKCLLRLNEALQQWSALLMTFTVDICLESKVSKIGGGSREKTIKHLGAMVLGQDFGNVVACIDA
jgi:hypothetical protein